MDFGTFARAWVQRRGLLDADADYNGMIGTAVLELVETLRNQGHSGMSALLTTSCFTALLRDYDNPLSQEWREYWLSDEGRKMCEDMGITAEDVIAGLESVAKERSKSDAA